MSETAAEHAPSYLIIGHVSRDRTSAGDRLGGTAVYAGLTAAAYGSRTTLITACAEDVNLSALSKLTVHRRPSPLTTVFENHSYVGGRRKQWIHAVAEPLTVADIPATVQSPDVVHLAPIAGEVTAKLFQSFPRALRCVTLQGLMRIRDSEGAVRHHVSTQTEAAAAAADVAIFSLDDVDGNEREAQGLVECCRMAVVTDGPQGCHIFRERHVWHYPAPKVTEVDSTGAGDIFAAVFFLRFWETNDPDKAAWMATQLASRSVTRKGLLGIPGGKEIDQAKR